MVSSKSSSQVQNIDLRKHMEGTYFALRAGLAVVAIAFPLLLLALAAIGRPPLQPSISEYYNVGGRMRDVLVGVLVAIGACLYLYKGFSKAENNALNLAGLFIVGVAWFPTGRCMLLCGKVTEHGLFAVLFFLCIGYVCVCRANDTLRLPTRGERGTKVPRTEGRVAAYKLAYWLLGVMMVASPLAAVIFNWFWERVGQRSSLIFWIEAFGVWVFGTFWALKSYELQQSRADELTLDRQTRRVKIPKPGKMDEAAVVDVAPAEGA
jgi:hypothetical protein